MRIEPGNILIQEYNYELPHEQIAEHPLPERDQSKLLIYQKGKIQDDVFSNISDHLPADATLILNNTRVIEARILFQNQTGSLIEIFCLEPFEKTIEISLTDKARTKWFCLIGRASKWKHGQALQKEIVVGREKVLFSAKYIDKQDDRFIIEFSWEPIHFSFADILHHAGLIPLPPYIKRLPDTEDKERYQTIFSKYEGSVAAPTAALHFTPAIFQQFSAKNILIDHITLHVGAGTFKPVKTASLEGHQMHSEPFTVSKTALENLIGSKTIIAVGTTSLRTLESLYWLGIKKILGTPHEWKLEQWEAYELEEKIKGVHYTESLKALANWMIENDQAELHCETSLIIVPGYEFKIPSALVTNFHQPQSTLLLLVSAFIGEDWKKVYSHALENDYRFLSYGDSSLLWRSED